MAAGDAMIDGSALGCGCSKYVTRSVGKAWPGTMFLIVGQNLGYDVARILYFKNFQDILIDETNIPTQINSRAAASRVYSVSYSTEVATFGVATTSLSNPDNLYVPNEDYPSFPIVNADLSLGVGEYAFTMYDGYRQRTSFTPGTKYSFRMRFFNRYINVISNPDFAGSNYRLIVAREWIFTDEINESEFDTKLRLLPMASRVDSLGFTQRKIATNQWAGGGHACRLIVDRTDDFIESSTLMMGTDLNRGYGIMRSATIYSPPGFSSIRSHNNSTPATSANSLALFTSNPGVAISQDGGSYWTTRDRATNGNIPDYGATTACSNVELTCESAVTIAAPSTNQSIEFRELEVCPP